MGWCPWLKLTILAFGSRYCLVIFNLSYWLRFILVDVILSLWTSCLFWRYKYACRIFLLRYGNMKKRFCSCGDILATIQLRWKALIFTRCQLHSLSVLTSTSKMTNCLQEAQIQNEKYILEKRIAYMRMVRGIIGMLYLFIHFINFLLSSLYIPFRTTNANS